MLRILIEALLCAPPFIFLFLSLYQTSSWKIASFRWGVVVLKFSEPFPIKIPNSCIGEIIEYKGIIFKFVSQKLGLFQAKVMGRNISPSHDSLISGIFPIMGEIILDEAGNANMSLRIPYSTILMLICILIALFGFAAISRSISFDLSFMLTGILFIGSFTTLIFFMEKAQ